MIVARVTVAVAVLIATIACSSAQALDTADRRPFEVLVRAALTAAATSFIPDPPVCPGPVSAGVRQRLLADLPNRLSPYFGGAQLDQELSIATGVVRNDDGPACIYGGGVDWVRLDHLKLTATDADATGQTRLWSRSAQWQGHPVFAEPHNTLNATFHLSKADGHWLITRYQWSFAPGSEP